MDPVPHAAAAPIANNAGDPTLALFIVVVAAMALIAILAAYLFHARSIDDKQLKELLSHHAASNSSGNFIWHYANITSSHALRRNEFWNSTIQIIGAIVVIAILSALLIYHVISAEAALPIISAVSGFGLSRASSLNPSDTTKPKE
jgi:hypothetical protein